MKLLLWSTGSCLPLLSQSFSLRPTFTSTARVTPRPLHSTMGLDDRTYGIEGPRQPRRIRGTEDLVDPEKDIQKYIRAPEPVPARDTLDGTVLVSGWVKSADRSDQAVFDLLNHEDAAFHFHKIRAFVPDEKLARKRLLSRSARYTGLLDKLQFAQAESEGAGPTPLQMEGVHTWVAHVECDPAKPDTALLQVKKIAQCAANSPDLKNVAVLLSNAAGLTNVHECVEAIHALDGVTKEREKAFTIVAVAALDDKPEGSRPYTVGDFGTQQGVQVLQGGKMSRDESLRLLTECLALESGKNKALVFAEVDKTEDSVAAKLIKGLREAGYTRPQEIHHMIVAGVANYTNAIDEYKAKMYELENPDPEKLRREKEEADRMDKEAFTRQQQEFEERKRNEIEEIARSWAKREYFRKSMSGNMGMTEEEYIESVWDRAMFEGDLKYRMMHGGATDERKELSEFLEKQEKKKQTALKKAREALEGQLDTPIGSVRKSTDGDDDDDDDE